MLIPSEDSSNVLIGGSLSNLSSETLHQIVFHRGPTTLSFKLEVYPWKRKRQTQSISLAPVLFSRTPQQVLNNLGRALWKLNYSLQHDEVSSQLGVPLVDSLLDNSVAWQAIWSDGDEYISIRGRVIPSSLCPFQLHQPQAL